MARKKKVRFKHNDELKLIVFLLIITVGYFLMNYHPKKEVRFLESQVNVKDNVAYITITLEPNITSITREFTVSISDPDSALLYYRDVSEWKKAKGGKFTLFLDYKPVTAKVADNYLILQQYTEMGYILKLKIIRTNRDIDAIAVLIKGESFKKVVTVDFDSGS